MIGMCIRKGMWRLRRRRWGGMGIRDMSISQRRKRHSSRLCMRIADECGYGMVSGADWCKRGMIMLASERGCTSARIVPALSQLLRGQTLNFANV